MEDELKARKAKRRMEAQHRDEIKKEIEVNEEVKPDESKDMEINNINNQEEIKEDVKNEYKIENEIQEQVETVPIEEHKKEDLPEYKEQPKKRRVGKIISRIFWTLLLLFVIFETVIGFLDMSRLNDDKEPVWYFSQKTEKSNGKTETTYNLGLYVIVKTTQGKEKQLSLKPFFLK